MLKFKKNPFPGMNPWLEAYWGDIHTSLTTYARDHIQTQLPADLQARVEEYLSVIEPDEESRKLRRISHDVQIVHQPGFAPSGTAIALEDIEADQPLRVRRRSEPLHLSTVASRARLCAEGFAGIRNAGCLDRANVSIS